VLALAEVKQTWDAYPAGDAPWDDYYGYDEDEDEGSEDAVADDHRQQQQQPGGEGGMTCTDEVFGKGKVRLRHRW
jgi:hypothetical protein